MIRAANENEYYELDSPTEMPKASGFLWNETMMVQASCRGYAVAQFMQPEPAKYSHAPNLEAKTFMQPEQPYYAHHPGRFVYVKDEENGKVFSAPHEPVRIPPSKFRFSAGKNDIRWSVENMGICVEMRLSLPKEEPLELWRVKITNASQEKRKLSIYPYFTVGYMSWMNQEGEYKPDLQAIVCSSVTPYQKYEDYEAIKNFSDKTFLLAQEEPVSWEANQERFEGEGGLLKPSALIKEKLDGGDARYEMPVCVLQYQLNMEPGEEKEFRFLFGPAKDDAQINQIRKKYFTAHDPGEDGFESAEKEYARYIAQGKGCIHIETADKDLDNFVNHWLPRQMYYHGKTNRLTLDPQTRNYLQDGMGMTYIKPEAARAAFLLALSQQHENGSMPDGIKLHKDVELKYINQIPHTDHCVWLPICLGAYLDETNDYEMLDEMLPFAEISQSASVLEHVNRGLGWLISDRDERGLNYINQGDWCDPMNMVGYKGKGVSGWLTIATAYSLFLWSAVCEKAGRMEKSFELKKKAEDINKAANAYLWDGNWYARGITDDGRLFGISRDKEGMIYINPQSFALLSKAADEEKKALLLKAVQEHLETPYGVEKLAPPYTAMREDIGRLTQKYPGSAENGAVYNHAAAFYIFALYSIGESNHAYRLLRKMIPGPNVDDILQRGQLPVFIPNYYRGAYKQMPKTAGRSSHLFNTGTVSWFYRCVMEGLFGLRGLREGLSIRPQLPLDWQKAKVMRMFRGAQLHIAMERDSGVKEVFVYVNGVYAEDGIVRNTKPGMEYQVLVKIPPSKG